MKIPCRGRPVCRPPRVLKDNPGVDRKGRPYAVEIHFRSFWRNRNIFKGVAQEADPYI